MTHKLYPDIGTSYEEQPRHWDEKEANHIGRDGNANEESGERLERNVKIVAFVQLFI